jgi:hypothetical protein
LGRLVSGTHFSPRARAARKAGRHLIHQRESGRKPFCDRLADARDPLDLGKPTARDGPRRTEMVQQGLLAPRADPWDLVERRLADRLGPLGAMRADDKTVRLVAQPLQKVEDGIARFERERRSARQEESFCLRQLLRPRS